MAWGDELWGTFPWGAEYSDAAKIRIRASDGYSKTSDWVVSAAFTVLDNSAPSVTLVSPTNGGLTTGNTPYLTFLVGDSDGDAIHVEAMLSLSPTFATPYYFKSALSQDGWEEAASPFSSWSALGSGGATSGNRVRYTCPALRFDVFFLKYRSFDGILYSDWSGTVAFRVTPSGAVPLTCSIGAYSYSIMGLRVQEKTGGEGSPMSFRIPLSVLTAQPINRGDSVSIGLAVGGQTRSWNGTVEGLLSAGAEVTVDCLQDDAYLARKLVRGDEEADDVGAILKAFVDDYGAPLGSGYMDTTLGVTAPIAGNYQTLLQHLSQWAQLLGLMLWVDSEGEVHLVDPADLPEPVYILREAGPA